MKQLWAPWRIEYIEAEKDGACVFCKATDARPGEGLVLFNGAVSVVLMNKYPYNNGHLLVAPVRHIARIEELTPEETIDMFRLIRHSTAVLTKAMNPGGFNIGMNVGKDAGAGIDDHLHMHVVPRWNGDTNFMPVLADTRVMPEHLQQTLSKLLPYFERLGE